MESQNYHSESRLELSVDEEVAKNLREGAGWAQFISIIGLVILGLSFIFMLFGTLAASAFSGGGVEKGGYVLVALFSALIMCGIGFFPLYYLLQYASKVKQATSTFNQEEFIKAAGFLKKHHKFVGITIIVGIAFWVLMLVVGLSVASMM
jgi:hypothetical protein